MAYNEKLADRCREIIASSARKIEEKSMFGGLCFMVDQKMCVGVEKERLMLRLDPSKVEALLEEPGCTPMDFTGRVMKGFVFVSDDVLDRKSKLEFWLGLALQYNKIAKVKKKSKTGKKKTVAAKSKPKSQTKKKKT
jgi:TfoX/Sxy family transcriptional regulator of competence genes